MVCMTCSVQSNDNTEAKNFCQGRPEKGKKGNQRYISVLKRMKHQPFSVTLSKESHTFEKCHPQRTVLLQKKKKNWKGLELTVNYE